PADELDAEPAAAELGEHVDVGEVDRRDAVGEGAGEADLAPAGVEADDAARLADRPLDGLARAALRPVRVVREEVVNRVHVDPAGVVVELDALAQVTPHGGQPGLEPDHPLPLVGAGAVAVLRAARAA